MSDLTSYAATLRAGQHWMEACLSTPAETVVAICTVTSVPAVTTTAISMTVDGGYSHTDIEADMEIEVTTSSGVHKGRLRVGYGGATATVLQVEEFSLGRMRISVGDKLRVLRSWRVHQKLVSNDGSYNKDSRIAYADQNLFIDPLARTGGLWVGDVTANIEDNVALVPFFGSLSAKLDPQSGSNAAHLWGNVPAYETGSSSSANIVGRFAPGTTWVDYTYTDSDRNTRSKRRNVVIVHDDDHPPMSIASARINGSRREGYTCHFVAAADCGIQALPNGAMVVLWKREWRNHSRYSSLGGALESRSHIKGVFYLIQHSIRVNPDNDTVEFDAVSALHIARSITGWSQALRNSANPLSWQEFYGLTVMQMAVYLLRWHTTIPLLSDIYWNVTDYPYPELFIQKSTPTDQVAELVDGIASQLRESRCGSLYVVRSLQRAPAAERDAADVLYHFTADDRRGDFSPSWRHRKEVAKVEGLGFTSAAAPLKSEAPGTAEDEAVTTKKVERQILPAPDGTGQLELNQRTGDAFAEYNSTYDGLPVPKGVPMLLPTGYDFIDFGENDWIQVTMAAADNRRGESLTAARFIVDRFEIEYDNETGMEVQSLTIDHETRGEPGEIRIIPTRVTPSDPSEPPQTTTPDVPLGANVRNVAFVDDLNNLVIVRNVHTTSPQWSKVALALDGDAGDFREKPWNTLDAVIVTSEAIYLLEDVHSSSRVLTKVHDFGFTIADPYRMRVEMDKQSPNVIVVQYPDGTEHYTIRSLDDGETWETPVLSSAELSLYADPGLSVSSHAANRVFASEGNDGLSATEGKVSTDGGATYTDSTSPDFDSSSGAHGLVVPRFNNLTDDLAYFGWKSGSTTRLYRAKGTVQTDISPETYSDPWEWTFNFLANKQGWQPATFPVVSSDEYVNGQGWQGRFMLTIPGGIRLSAIRFLYEDYEIGYSEPQPGAGCQGTAYHSIHIWPHAPTAGAIAPGITMDDMTYGTPGGAVILSFSQIAIWATLSLFNDDFTCGPASPHYGYYREITFYGTGRNPFEPFGRSIGPQYSRSIAASRVSNALAIAGRGGASGTEDPTIVCWTHNGRTAAVTWNAVDETRGTHDGGDYWTAVRYSDDNAAAFWAMGDAGLFAAIVNGEYRDKAGDRADIEPVGRLLWMMGLPNDA